MQFIKRLGTQFGFVVLMGASMFSASSASAQVSTATLYTNIDVILNPVYIQNNFFPGAITVDVVNIGGIHIVQNTNNVFLINNFNGSPIFTPFLDLGLYGNDQNLGNGSIFNVTSQPFGTTQTSIQGLFQESSSTNPLIIGLTSSGPNPPKLSAGGKTGDGTVCPYSSCTVLHYGYSINVDSTLPLNPLFLQSTVTLRNDTNSTTLSRTIPLASPQVVFNPPQSQNTQTEYLLVYSEQTNTQQPYATTATYTAFPVPQGQLATISFTNPANNPAVTVSNIQALRTNQVIPLNLLTAKALPTTGLALQPVLGPTGQPIGGTISPGGTSTTATPTLSVQSFSGTGANANAIVGAGASSITTLFDDNRPAPASEVWSYANGFGTPYNYVVTGSGAGRTAFLNGTTFLGQRINFVATDGIGTTFGANTVVRNNTIFNTVTNAPVNDPISGVPYVVVNEATLNIAFPYNVPNFNVTINGETACRIIRGNTSLGDPVNWSQVVNTSGVRGPNLPIRRVARGDGGGTTATLQGTSTSPNPTNFGFIQACNGQVATTPGGTTLFPAAPSFTGSGAIPSIVPATSTGFNDGTLIPNRRTGTTGDIIVNAAPSNGTTADPFGAAAASGDDNNSGSYTLGVINTVRNTPGAIGYTESAAAVNAGLTLAVDTQSILPNGSIGAATTAAVGPTYVIFRGNYFLPNGQQDSNTVAHAQDACYGAIFSGYLSNNSPSVYPRQAGFNINTAGGAFPYLFPSPEAGFDTDNYGSYGALAGGNEFGPCSRIGGAGVVSPNERTIAATLTVSGSTRTLSSFTFLGSNPAVTTGNPVAGDIIDATTSSGTIVRGTVLSVSGNTLRLYVNQSNTSGIVFDSGNSNPGQTNNVYTFNF